MKKRWLAILMMFVFLLGLSGNGMQAIAKGATYEVVDDVYYTKADCVVYAEPTYTSMVLTTIGSNVPIKVLGSYSNGWYRINIGNIAYCKMDSLTTAGDVGIVEEKDKQAYAAKQIADSLGYEFHYLKLNKQKTIKKDIFNSYVKDKVILFVRIDDEIAISFKMIYEDKVKSDVVLDFTKTYSFNNCGDRTILIKPSKYTELPGQVAIFQFKVGYDKAVDMNVIDMDSGDFNLMNTYYTEFEEFAYAPVTQIADMNITEMEVIFSLEDDVRAKMSDIKQGIKYKEYDELAYRNSIHSKLRKDTEYIDYVY